MPRYDAILFDFDGVLLDSEPLHCDCWAEVLAPFGVNLAWEEYSRRYIGLDDRIMLQMIASEARPPLDWDTLWAQYPAKKELFRGDRQRPRGGISRAGREKRGRNAGTAAYLPVRLVAREPRPGYSGRTGKLVAPSKPKKRPSEPLRSVLPLLKELVRPRRKL